ncbi:alginate export family protein [Thiorhodococcus mannitoliphagus]|uniref:Alginate export family protein n=1 Tax=Thiorhodococcus mannitoliphagus TaxID=329406 RepID=A0A6P1DPT9_9GAMM|nr:alginate export family protein [Thiorhodococcus mannitoliphagus]NEX18931.1 alginate export family protein [Thiorhodococcus mannitoliphagus]
MAFKKTLIAAGLSATLAAPALSADNTSGPFSWGADLRLRQVWIDNVGLNAASPTADRTFQRYRTRLWGGYQLTDQISASARLIWEGRHYQAPNASDWPVPGFETWYSGGILFDQLAVDFKQIGGSPLSVKLGRQDLILGNGWLVLEGTPLDGSRTIYFDAARATYALASADTMLDLIFINQSANTGRFPQSLNGKLEDQIEQYETGIVLYARNKSLVPDTDLDGYFIYKHDRPNLTPNNIRVNNGAPFPSPSDSGDIYAAGLRADAKLAPAWSLRAEGAYEWGTRNQRDLSAFGLNSRLTYSLDDRLKNQFHASYEFLSGDDPSTSNDEAFDPLWGRWPQWSELMIYQWPLESRVGEATNLQRLNVGWDAQVHPTTKLMVDYHALWADQNSTRTEAQMVNISGDDRFRGHLFTTWLKTKLNEHVSGHLVGEYLLPGDYYAENRRDDSFFVRVEVVLAW